MRRLTTAALAGIVLLLAATVPAAAAPAGSTFLVSRPDGFGPVPLPGDNDSRTPAVSADGRHIAFDSLADGFAAGADPRVANVFVRDTRTGTTALASRSDGLDGAGANADARTLGVTVEPGAVAAEAPHDRPHVIVVFATTATNLVDHADGAAPPGAVERIWARDVTAGTTVLVSRADGRSGAPADGAARQASVATGPGGPLIAFRANATNLGAGPGLPSPDGPLHADVYVRDLNRGQTRLVSCHLRDCAAPASAGFAADPAARIVEGPVIGPRGLVVCPSGSACLLVAFTTNDGTISTDAAGHLQVVVASAVAGASGLGAVGRFVTASVSASSVDQVGRADSHSPSITPFGAVLFISDDGGLATPVMPDGRDVVYRHTLNGATNLVAKGPNGTFATGVTSVSAGGERFVGFTSRSPDLGSPVPFGSFERAYVQDLTGDTTRLLDHDVGGAARDARNRAVALSEDGATAAFDTEALRGFGDVRGGTDFARVAVRRLEPGGEVPATEALELASRPDGTGAFPTGVRASAIPAGRSVVSADGRFVAFESESHGIAGGQDERVRAVFVRDLLAGSTTLVSRADGPDGTAVDRGASVGGISDDGRRVLFTTTANLIGRADDVRRTYVRDLATQRTFLVSRANGATGSPAEGLGLDISGDGDSVVFVSESVIDPDAGSRGHLYVRRLDEDSTTLVDRESGPAGRVAEDRAFDAAIDRDGGRVAWSTDARLGIVLVGEVLTRVFRRDLRTSDTVLVSRAAGATGAPVNADADHPAISATGDVVAFVSKASNLGAPVTHRAVWVRDLRDGGVRLASRADGAAGAIANADSGGAATLVGAAPSLDAAGERVAFVTTATNLGVTPRAPDETFAYVRDLAAQRTELVSRADGVAGAQPDPAGGSGFVAVSLSGNGDCAAFSGRGLNLGDGFPSADFTAVRMRALRGECPLGPPAAAGPPPADGAPPVTPGGPGVPPAPRADRPAVLSALSLRPARFRTAGRRRGTRIRFRLSKRSAVTLRFARVVGGRRAGGRCFARRRKGRRCTIVRRVGRPRVVRARTGVNSVRFSGQLGRRTLAAGRYRVIATPSRGRSRTAGFTIVKARRR